MSGTREPTGLFGPMAEAYAAARPGYPARLFAAIRERAPRRPARALDLAAGTGAATAGLLDAGARTVVVEPDPAMVSRAAGRLAGRTGWLGAVVGRAEAVPLAGAAVGVVTVAQAFHWFEEPAALDEIARVLVPGGILAVVWNVVEEEPFVEAVLGLVERYNPGYHRPVDRSRARTPAALSDHPAFEVEPPAAFPHDRTMDADRYLAYAFSWSFCGGALDPAERGPFERDLRALVAEHHGDRPWRERIQAWTHFARRV